VTAPTRTLVEGKETVVRHDPRFTLKVYAQASKRRDRLTGPHLKAYDRTLEWAQMGTSAELLLADSANAARNEEKSPA